MRKNVMGLLIGIGKRLVISGRSSDEAGRGGNGEGGGKEVLYSFRGKNRVPLVWEKQNVVPPPAGET